MSSISSAGSIVVLMVLSSSLKGIEPPVIIVGKIPAKMVVESYGSPIITGDPGPSQEALTRWGNPFKAEWSIQGNKSQSLHSPSSKALGARHARELIIQGSFNRSRTALARQRFIFEAPYIRFVKD